MRRCVEFVPSESVSNPQFSSGSAPHEPFSGSLPKPQIVFLRIDRLLYECALRAEEQKPRPLRRSENVGAEHGPHTVGIMKHDVERIVRQSALPLDTNVRGDSFGLTKEHHRVIDDMRPDIEKNSRAGRRFFAPRVWLEVRAKAIVVRLEPHDATQRSGGDEFANRLKIAVVAAILIHGEKSPGLFGKVYEVDGFGVRSRKGLVDDNIVPRSESGASERSVRIVWACDDDQSNIAQSEKLIERSNDFRIGIRLRPLHRPYAEESRRGASSAREKSPAREMRARRDQIQ